MAKGSLNKVMIIGRLGKDPELRYTPNGSPVANFTVATDEGYRSKDGNNVEKTEWHRVVAWNKLAEICGEWLKKGSLVYIEGSLETRSWEQDGTTRYTTEIKARDMTMLGGRGGSSAPSSGSAPAAKSSPPAPAPAAEAEEDDLPF